MVADLPACGVVAFWCYSGDGFFLPSFGVGWLVGWGDYVRFGAYPGGMRFARG